MTTEFEPTDPHYYEIYCHNFLQVNREHTLTPAAGQNASEQVMTHFQRADPHQMYIQYTPEPKISGVI